MTAPASGLTSAPPRVAAFFVELFAAPHEATGILGDLEEDFRARVATEGVLSARRRYWSQSLRTIRDLAFAPSWTLFGLGVIGFASIWPVGWAFMRLAETIVIEYPVYSYIPAAIFWRVTRELGPLTTAMLLALLARAIKLRPMNVAIAVTAVAAVVFAVDIPVGMLLFGPPPWRTAPPWWPLTPMAFLARWAYSVTLTGALMLAGAAIGRTLRLPAIKRIDLA